MMIGNMVFPMMKGMIKMISVIMEIFIIVLIMVRHVDCGLWAPMDRVFRENLELHICLMDIVIED